MRPDAKRPYSWREDIDVPDFDDARTVLVMDGDCALCSGAARFITKLDRTDNIRIATAQSPLGCALFAHFGVEPGDPETWLMLRDGQAFGSIDAMTRLFPGLHWALKPLVLLRLLPLGLQDWVYARIARNRYSIFGRTDLCALPDPELRRRLIS